MHGVDWEAMCRNYERFLPHIGNDYDFAEMTSELLGELNVSHTGCRYSRPASDDDDATADLGLIFDFGYRGDGLLVAEVVAGAPFDKASSEVRAGDVVERIDGQEIGRSRFLSFAESPGRTTHAGFTLPALDRKTLGRNSRPHLPKRPVETVVQALGKTAGRRCRTAFERPSGICPHRIDGRCQFPHGLRRHAGTLQPLRRNRRRYPV
ncbi:MAG: hypothetical protein ACLT1W_15130 [Alistipes onderdonkii]